MKQREIKFRAWDGRHKKMHYGVGMLNGVLYLSQGKKLTTTKTLMQYTGLKDKNGKEIYEGDIIEGSSGDRWKVVWDAHYVAFRGVNGTRQRLMGEEIIIGNIYETPSLLKDN